MEMVHSIVDSIVSKSIKLSHFEDGGESFLKRYFIRMVVFHENNMQKVDND